MSEQEWFSKDFYKVLGVDKTADKKAITKAYRKLARQWHPDQNPGDKAAEAKFKEIGEAYAVLSNDEDRKRYDAIRAMAGGGARFSAGSGGAGGFEDLFGAFGGADGITCASRPLARPAAGLVSRIFSRASSALAAVARDLGATPTLRPSVEPVTPSRRHPPLKRVGTCAQSWRFPSVRP